MAVFDAPSVSSNIFWPEGFNDAGINLSFLILTIEFYTSLDVGIFRGDAIGKAEDPEISASGIKDLRGYSPIFVGRLGSFFSLIDFSNLDVGLSASYGILINPK